jgi:repressor LexA
MDKTTRKGLTVLTKRQRNILNFITTFIETEGYAPTLDEVRAHLGLSAVSTVHEHIEKLIAKGYLERGWNQSRSISLTPMLVRQQTSRLIPLLGRVAAGTPIEAIPDPEDIAVPESLLGKGETYSLRVNGDSMMDEGILDGDTLVVARASVADNGALVIALVGEGEVVVKRFYTRGQKWVELISANENHPPMRFNAKDIRIQGVVVGLMRNYR